jgi:anti-sigma regulatory factor (Ser/Thr protein kinase)
MTTRLELKADVEELGRLADSVATFAETHGVDPLVTGRLTVALDEVVTNAIMYGDLGADASIFVDLSLDGGDVVATVTDPGPAFDPLTSPPVVDTTLPLEERPVGGLGLFIVRQLARDLAYRHVDGCNCLTMRLAPDGVAPAG